MPVSDGDTVELDGGRFFNLVLFKDAASVRQWRDGEKHDETVKTFSKTHYDAVRIHMGELKGGLEGPGEFIVRHTLRNEYFLSRAAAVRNNRMEPTGQRTAQNNHLELQT